MQKTSKYFLRRPFPTSLPFVSATHVRILYPCNIFINPAKNALIATNDVQSYVKVLVAIYLAGEGLTEAEHGAARLGGMLHSLRDSPDLLMKVLQVCMITLTLTRIYLLLGKNK